MSILKIGTKVRVGGSKGPIETISDYYPETRTYKLVSDYCTGYISLDDCIPLIPVKPFEQLSLF